MDKALELATNMARKAVKMALIACVITTIFAVLSLWVLLNQITATANLVKAHKTQESRLEKLEFQCKNIESQTP